MDLNLIPIWKSNHTKYKVWGWFIHPFSHFYYAGFEGLYFVLEYFHYISIYTILSTLPTHESVSHTCKCIDLDKFTANYAANNDPGNDFFLWRHQDITRANVIRNAGIFDTKKI